MKRLIVALALVASVAHAETAKDAFDRMKALAGTWSGKLGEQPFVVTYHVTGGGTALVETLFSGMPHEMVTVYTLDGEDLVATHYCSAGNQPSLRYDAAKSSADKLIFDFAGVRGAKANGYMHDAEFRLTGADSLQSLWSGIGADGQPQPPHVFNLTRAK
jgi:hypothetical protein